MNKRWMVILGLFLTVALAATNIMAAPAETSHGEASGEPQLLPAPGKAQIVTAITTLVIFVLLLIVLSKFAWGPIVTGLRGREEKIRKDIADAEAARAKADATLREYTARLAAAEQSVREMLGKATTDAERIATSFRMQAQQDAEEIKERANQDIESTKKQALAEIYEQTANLATGVAAKILRRELNADDQRDLVNRSLEQLQTISK